MELFSPESVFYEFCQEYINAPEGKHKIILVDKYDIRELMRDVTRCAPRQVATAHIGDTEIFFLPNSVARNNSDDVTASINLGRVMRLGLQFIFQADVSEIEVARKIQEKWCSAAGRIGTNREVTCNVNSTIGVCDVTPTEIKYMHSKITPLAQQETPVTDAVPVVYNEPLPTGQEYDFADLMDILADVFKHRKVTLCDVKCGNMSIGSIQIE